MNIVHIAPSLARGGGERLMIELANAASEDGHRVTVLLGFPLPSERAHEGLSEKVKREVISTSASPLRRYIDLFRWLRRHRTWLTEQDVIHCHMTYGAVAGTLAKWLLRGHPDRPAIVETYHAVGMPIPRSHLWLHTRMAAGRDALAFMVDHPYWREFRRRRPDIPSSIIPAGVPLTPSAKIATGERRRRREALGIHRDEAQVVGTIGRLVPARQPWLYLPVFARIIEKLGTDVQFVIGGDGPEESRIRTDIETLGIADQVHLAGLVRDVNEIFSILDLYVTLNVGPVPGVAGLQAIAAGVPVIGVQGNDHDGESDWIWSSSDPGRLADKAIELLRSEAARAELAKAQRAHLEAHHSAAAMARDYESLYRRAVARVSGDANAEPAPADRID